MSREGISNKDFLVGTVIGGVVGAMTALLLAPKSGRELRTDLNEQATYVRLKTEELKHNVYEKGQSLAETAKDKTAHLSQTISGQSAQVMDKVKALSKTSDNPGEQEQEELPPTSLQVLEDEVENQQSEETDVQKKLEETRQALEEVEGNIRQ